MEKNSREIIVIVGPTASGKSQIAMELTKDRNSVIINADSLQIYEDIPILTAQPSYEDRAEVLHRLYGYLPYDEKNDVVKWASQAAAVIEKSFIEGQTPIVVGGTGLYIRCLLKGISKLPQISAEIRAQAMAMDYKQLCLEVYENDPKLKEQLRVDQHHQIIRAYEVLKQSGKSIRFFFGQPKLLFLENVIPHFIMPFFERAALYKNIEVRFKKMIQKGAIEEVETLLQKTNGQTNFPIFQAIGAFEISQYLKKEITLDEAIDKSLIRSRHYAKRQDTWFRNQIKEVKIFEKYKNNNCDLCETI